MTRVIVGFRRKKGSRKSYPITKPVGELKRGKVIQKPKSFKGVSPKNKVIQTAKSEVARLRKWASKIEVAGSIRRGLKPSDVDIVVVPKSAKAKQSIIDYAQRQPKGNIGRGERLVAYKKGGVEVDIYFAEPKYYGAMLMFLTGPNKYNIGLRFLAKNKGLKLNQYGVWKGNRCLGSKTEKDVYKALGKEFKSPELRGLTDSEIRSKFGVSPGTRVLS